MNIGYPFIYYEKYFLAKSGVAVVLYEIRKNAIFCRKQTVPASLGIRSIPTLMVFKKGEMVERLVGGNIPKSVLAETLLKHA